MLISELCDGQVVAEMGMFILEPMLEKDGIGASFVSEFPGDSCVGEGTYWHDIICGLWWIF